MNDTKRNDSHSMRHLTIDEIEGVFGGFIGETVSNNPSSPVYSNDGSGSHECTYASGRGNQSGMVCFECKS